MHYLLIHGSWHGAWCWDLLSPLLSKQGHKVSCSDLPGSGNDAHNALDVTYEHLQDCVTKTIKSSPGPLVVVAHSFARLASFACKIYPKIKHIFYIVALLSREVCPWSIKPWPARISSYHRFLLIVEIRSLEL